MPNEPSSALALLQSNGVVYVPGEYRGWTHRLLIAGSTGNQYTVSMRVSDQVWGCSCPGWIFHRRCQHLDQMLPSLMKAVPGSRISDPLRPKLRISAPVGPPGAPSGGRDVVAQVLSEAELKRQERVRRIVSGEAYKKVTPGSPEQWAGAAAAFISGDISFMEDARAYKPAEFKARPTQIPLLAALFLERMPTTPEELRAGYRNAVMRVFRDANFVDTSTEYVSGFTKVTSAYDRLKQIKHW